MKRDICIIKSDTYTHTVTFNTSQADYTFSAVVTDGTTDTAMTVTTVSDSQIILSLTATQTNALQADGTPRYKWRLVRTQGSTVNTVLAGKATVIDL